MKQFQAGIEMEMHHRGFRHGHKKRSHSERMASFLFYWRRNLNPLLRF
ncbi:hypothetical protein P872_08920 [Rhodonellum psychrophilum GCM71 = DSM 17998]|uniref:Uncharacterized protein n=1 Tax=Rhodonellum psychrophilum GCM71 = DSM 17998 TaxID=1123057 RepID=U5BVH5_9BACT|nr:hypothetical protein P872_08920 [Rhodonellum psychrophilum GCM71 = DSM 17998]